MTEEGNCPIVFLVARSLSQLLFLEDADERCDSEIWSITDMSLSSGYKQFFIDRPASARYEF